MHVLLCFRISVQSTTCSLRESSLAEQFRENPLITHRIRDVQTELQSAVMMDRARLSYSAATTVTVATET